MKKVGMIFLVILVILLVYFNIWVYRVYNRPPIIANEQVDRQDVIENSQNTVSTEKFDEGYEYERIYKEYSFEDKNIEATEENIEEALKEINPDFDIDNYEVENTFSGVTKVNSDGTYETVDMPKYINYTLKLGEFKITVGYVVQVRDGKIYSVNENGLTEEGINLLLANKDYFAISKSEIDSFIERAKEEYSKNSARKILDCSYLCSYDLSSKKKSIYIELETERYETDSMDIVTNGHYTYEID